MNESKKNSQESPLVKPENRKGGEKREFVNSNPDEKTPDELRQIEEIRNKLQENIINHEYKEEIVSPNPKEIEVIDGQEYIVEYVSRESIYPAFGYGGGYKAVVREDLSPRIKRFVAAHELYHCIDRAKWGGWVGREIRANLIPGLKDPVGLMATIWATVSDIERIKFYINRVKKGC